MEMQEISIEGARNEEDAGARNEEDAEESEPSLKAEANTEDLEEAEAYPYSILQRPSEDVYSEAYYGGAPAKPKAVKQTVGNPRLYRAACILLTIICLVLLLVIIILSVKIQTGSQVCPVSAQPKTADATCSYEECQDHFPAIQPRSRTCRQCADGWLTLGQSCFFLSTYRLSWAESQRNCSARGGSLAVISNQRTQRFLTKEGKMQYWIGLKQISDSWTWVGDTALEVSYWEDNRGKGRCGILKSEGPPEKNWITAGCQAYTYFICELTM